MTTEQIAQLREAFHLFAIDGVVPTNCLGTLLRSVGHNPSDAAIAAATSVIVPDVSHGFTVDAFIAYMLSDEPHNHGVIVAPDEFEHTFAIALARIAAVPLLSPSSAAAAAMRQETPDTRPMRQVSISDIAEAMRIAGETSVTDGEVAQWLDTTEETAGLYHWSEVCRLLELTSSAIEAVHREVLRTDQGTNQHKFLFALPEQRAAAVVKHLSVPLEEIVKSAPSFCSSPGSSSTSFSAPSSSSKKGDDDDADFADSCCFCLESLAKRNNNNKNNSNTTTRIQLPPCKHASFCDVCFFEFLLLCFKRGCLAFACPLCRSKCDVSEIPVEMEDEKKQNGGADDKEKRKEEEHLSVVPSRPTLALTAGNTAAGAAGPAATASLAVPAALLVASSQRLAPAAQNNNNNEAAVLPDIADGSALQQVLA